MGNIHHFCWVHCWRLKVKHTTFFKGESYLHRTIPRSNSKRVFFIRCCLGWFQRFAMVFWSKPHPHLAFMSHSGSRTSCKDVTTIWNTICYWHLILFGVSCGYVAESGELKIQWLSLLRNACISQYHTRGDSFWDISKQKNQLYVACIGHMNEYLGNKLWAGTLPMVPTFSHVTDQRNLHCTPPTSLMASRTSGAASANPSALVKLHKAAKAEQSNWGKR